MSEKQIQPPIDPNERIEDNFAQINEWQNNSEAANAAKRLLDTDSDAAIAPNQNEATGWDMHEIAPRPNQRRANSVITKGSRVMLGAAIVTSGAGAAYIANDLHDKAQEESFSSATEVYTAVPGDGEFSIAEKIAGSDTEDTRDIVEHLKKNPTNAANFEDGVQSGETFIVPISINGAEPIPTVEK